MCHLCPFIITWVPGPNLDGFFPGYFFEKGNVYYHGYVERSKLINKKKQTPSTQRPPGSFGWGKVPRFWGLFQGRLVVSWAHIKNGEFSVALGIKDSQLFYSPNAMEGTWSFTPKGFGRCRNCSLFLLIWTGWLACQKKLCQVVLIFLNMFLPPSCLRNWSTSTCNNSLVATTDLVVHMSDSSMIKFHVLVGSCWDSDQPSQGWLCGLYGFGRSEMSEA